MKNHNQREVPVGLELEAAVVNDNVMASAVAFAKSVVEDKPEGYAAFGLGDTSDDQPLAFAVVMKINIAVREEN
jgi:hypothetical protein